MDPPQVVAVLGLEPDLMTPCYHHSTGTFSTSFMYISVFFCYFYYQFSQYFPTISISATSIFPLFLLLFGFS